jgi:phosphatidylcholine synthase
MSKKILAWCVHLYTASGLVAAAMMAVLIVRGGDEAFRWAFALMLLATFIDSTDGWLARRARVKEVLPGFDGRRLDDIIDFHTFTTLPLLLVWRAGILEGGQEWWLLLPLLASAYGFSQVNAKTEDGFFLGFPSYWNIIAFYLYIMRLPAWLALALIILPAILTFIPTRYLYPSQRGPFSLLTIILGSIWTVLLLLILWRWPKGTSSPLILISFIFPIYYMVISWALTLSRWRSADKRTSPKRRRK